MTAISVPTDPSKSIDVEFNYLAPLPANTLQPLPFDVNITAGSAKPNRRKLPLVDIRGCDMAAAQLNIDNAGFQYVKHHSTFLRQALDGGKDLAGKKDPLEETVNEAYGQEIRTVIEALFPQNTIRNMYYQGYTVRKSNSTAKVEDMYSSKEGARPATRPHIDTSGKAVRNSLAPRYGPTIVDDAIAAGQRFLYFSFWRPLKTVRRDPLAVCDARSVDTRDFVKIERYLEHIGAMSEVVLCAPRLDEDVKHQWYYMSEQTVDDLLVLKLYDSEHEAWEADSSKQDLRCVMHTACQVPGTEKEDSRESIEFRVGVVLK